MFKAKTALAALVLVGTATVAIAYAQNPAVQARQEAMGLIGGQVKTLTQMSKGEIAFDAAAAQAAVDAIAAKAAEVPALFSEKADDPESDAADEIWSNFDDFTAKAEALKAAATTTIDSPETLGAALGALGGTCKDCHSAYKL